MREPGKSRKSSWRRVRSAWAGLGRDRDGSALLYVTLSLPVLIGFAVLAIDGSRLMNLNSSLQQAADALALAGAGELDRFDDSCTRAVTAMTNLVDNDQRFGEAGLDTITIDDVSWRFLSELPVNDSDPIPSSMVVDCDANPDSARFVEVTVDPQDFSTIFPTSFLAGSDTVATDATAVAGFHLAVCKFTPMFICNPLEPDNNTDPLRSIEIYDHLADRALRRRQIEFKKHDGGSSQWSPGNYGYLQSAIGPGANALGESIASIDPFACFTQDGLYTKPGNTAVTRNAFNVRFDLYQGSYSRNNPNYRPALNVRKGYKVPPKQNGTPGNPCSAVKPDPAEPASFRELTRDSCFADDSCNTDFYARVGGGDWDFDGYWLTNFGATTKPVDEDGVPFSNDNRPTRYEIYRYEIDNNLLNTDSAGGEDGVPRCHNNAGAANDEPDRRLIYNAIMNCKASPISSGNSGGPYTAVAFGQFFITETMTGPNDSLWVELMGLVDPAVDSSVARDLVQLYR